MTDLNKVLTELDAKIPREVIQSRDGARGGRLDYLSGYYVIDRLNKVIGAGNWAYASDATKVFEGTTKGKYGDSFNVSYIAKVRLVVNLGTEKTEFIDYGYGDGSDKMNPGKAHELAVKESVTDGLKRCAKNLGMSFGLALYDKTQENVNDDLVVSEQDSVKSPPIDRSKLNRRIEALAKLFESHPKAKDADGKQYTMESFFTKISSMYGIENNATCYLKLSDAQASELITKLEEKING